MLNFNSSTEYFALYQPECLGLKKDINLSYFMFYSCFDLSRHAMTCCVGICQNHTWHNMWHENMTSPGLTCPDMICLENDMTWVCKKQNKLAVNKWFPFPRQYGPQKCGFECDRSERKWAQNEPSTDRRLKSEVQTTEDQIWPINRPQTERPKDRKTERLKDRKTKRP